MPVIQTDALTKSYGAARGIIEVTFEVAAGEVFGFLGPNGAGKTTTIRTLLDLIRPTSGRARVFGLDTHRDSVAIRRRVGFVPSENALYDRLTGEQLLTYLADLRGGVDPRVMRDLADRFRCDLSRPIGSLSHGNRQKITLVQAFMHRPDLVILDEPTQGLDPLMQQEFHRLIDEVREEGQTVFLSSHVMPEIDRLCHRVGIIREGRLIAVEDIAGLKARAAKRVEITFAGPAPADGFASIEGLADLSVAGSVLRCSMRGSLDALIKAASRFEVLDLTSHEASLEDIFLTYYGGSDG